MHIVHYSTKYDTAGPASKMPNGLAVMGVRFKVSILLKIFNSNIKIEPFYVQTETLDSMFLVQP